MHLELDAGPVLSQEEITLDARETTQTLHDRLQREHPPAHLGALTGALFQDPEPQLVMGSVGAELSLARESRGNTAAMVARLVLNGTSALYGEAPVTLRYAVRSARLALDPPVLTPMDLSEVS